MPLQEQIVNIPIAGGIDEGSSKKITTRLLSALNCRYAKPGQIGKRFGVTCVAPTNARLASGRPSPPTPTRLADFNGEIVRIGSGQLDSFSQTPGDGGGTNTPTDWAYRGMTSECAVRLTQKASIGSVNSSGVNTYGGPTVASDGSRYTVTAYSIYNADGAGSYTLVVDIDDATTGGSVYRAFPVSTGAYIVRCPRVIWEGTMFVLIWGDGGSNLIRFSTITTTTMAVAAPSTLIGGNYPDASLYSSSSGQIAVCCWNPGNTQVKVFGAIFRSGLSLTTTALSPNVTNNFLGAITIDGSSADGTVQIAYADITAGTPSSWIVQSASFALTMFTCTYQSIAQIQIGSHNRQIPQNLSIKRVAANQYMLVGNIADETTAGDLRYDCYGFWTTISVGASTPFIVSQQYNNSVNQFFFITRPFAYGGKVYAWGMNWHTRACSQFLIDLSYGIQMPANYHYTASPTNAPPRMVAVTLPEQWHGVAQGAAYPLRDPTITLSDVAQPSAGMFQHASLHGFIPSNGDSVVLVTTDFTRPLNTAVHNNTLVCAGGVVCGYDGATTFELGFGWAPDLIASDLTTATNGSSAMATGVYGYQLCWSWKDAVGNIYRSEVSLNQSVSVTSGQAVTVRWPGLNITNRVAPIRLEIYRTLVNSSTAYYLVGTAEDISNSNGSQFVDLLSDAQLLASPLMHPQLYLDTEVANTMPPAAAQVHHHQNRIWLGDTDDDSLWFSKSITSGSGPAWSDSFVFDPFDKPRVRALASINDQLVIFKTAKTFILNGSGPDDTGSNGSFSPISTLQSEIGCIDPRSVVSNQEGTFFMSFKGLCGIDVSGNVIYTGQLLEDTIGNNAFACAVYNGGNNYVRWALVPTSPGSQRGIVLDYDTKVGSFGDPVWTTHDYVDPSPFVSAYSTIVGMCNHKGVFYFINSAGHMFAEIESQYYDSITVPGASTYKNYVPSSGQLSWISVAGLNGVERVWYASILATYQDSHDITISLYDDYGISPAQSATWDNGVLYANQPEQLRMHVAKQELGAISFAWSEVAPTVAPAYTTGQGPIINAVALEVGVESGVRKQPSARSK